MGSRSRLTIQGTSIMLGVLELSCLDVPFYITFSYKRSEAVRRSSVVLVLIKLEPPKKSAWEVEFICRLMLPCAVSIPSWVLSGPVAFT